MLVVWFGYWANHILPYKSCFNTFSPRPHSLCFSVGQDMGTHLLPSGKPAEKLWKRGCGLQREQTANWLESGKDFLLYLPHLDFSVIDSQSLSHNLCKGAIFYYQITRKHLTTLDSPVSLKNETEYNRGHSYSNQWNANKLRGILQFSPVFCKANVNYHKMTFIEQVTSNLKTVLFFRNYNNNNNNKTNSVLMQDTSFDINWMLTYLV